MTRKPRKPSAAYVLVCKDHNWQLVPFADAILEVEEENARQYLESVKQDASPTVRKQPKRFACPTCGCTLFNWGARDLARCALCGLVTTMPERKWDRPPLFGGIPALLTPHSARQSGTQVGDQPYPDVEKEPEGDAGPEKEASRVPECVHCGWPDRNMAVVERIGPCRECGYDAFFTGSPTGTPTTFSNHGTLRCPTAYGGFKCARCGAKVP
jgi:hypothetical protein